MKRPIYIFCCIILMSLTTMAAAMSQQQTFESYLMHLTLANHHAGFVVLVEEPQSEQPIFLQAYGLANRAKHLNTQANDLFRIASASKPFIATLVIKLAMADYFNLQDKLADFLSSKQLQGIQNAQAVTIKQLLAMQSGIYNYTDSPKFMQFEMAQPDYDWTAEKALTFARNQSAQFAPGKACAYSNTNYILLGLLIEKVTGHSLAYELRRRIFEPLHLQHTFFERETMNPNVVNPGYTYSKSLKSHQLVLAKPQGLADGGIISTVSDLNTFIRNLMLNHTFMPEKWRKIMLKFHVMQDADDAEYGLGLVRFKVNGSVWIGHDGSDRGYQSLMLFDPKTKNSIIFLANSHLSRFKMNEFLKMAFINLS